MAASPDGIVRLAFDDHADFAALAARAEPVAAAASRATGSITRRTPSTGTSVVRREPPRGRRLDDRPGDQPRIARGDTGDPARRASLLQRLDVAASAYDRGYAMGSNPVPVLLPCHRVTRGAETLDDYVGGASRRQELTRFEQ